MSLLLQKFYCDRCNKLISIKCNYGTINDIEVQTDLDVEFELKAKVRCQDCLKFTSIILDPEMEDIVILLNKYGYKTIYSSANRDFTNLPSTYIIFDKNVKIPWRIRRAVPYPWKLYKENKSYTIKKCIGYIGTEQVRLNNNIQDLIILENFIFSYIVKKGKHNENYSNKC